MDEPEGQQSVACTPLQAQHSRFSCRNEQPLEETTGPYLNFDVRDPIVAGAGSDYLGVNTAVVEEIGPCLCVHKHTHTHTHVSPHAHIAYLQKRGQEKQTWVRFTRLHPSTHAAGSAGLRKRRLHSAPSRRATAHRAPITRIVGNIVRP